MMFVYFAGAVGSLVMAIVVALISNTELNAIHSLIWIAICFLWLVMGQNYLYHRGDK